MNGSVLDAGQIRPRLRDAAEPAFRASLPRFFPEPVDACGVRTPVLRRMAREIASGIRDWPAARRNRLCTGSRSV